MIFLAAFFVAMVVLFSWIIFMPVNIRINTASHRFQVSQAGTWGISFHPNADRPVVARVFGIKIDFRKAKPAGNGKTARKVGKKIRKSPEAWLFLFRGLLKSFHCKRFVCSLDLDDVVLNAQLVPVLYFLSHGPVHLSTNFRKEYFLDVFIQVRISQIFWPLLSFFLIKK